MQFPRDAERLRVYIGESDILQGRPRYELIVDAARRHGLGGATVFRGATGFGPDSLAQDEVSGISEDLPIVIEIIDSPGIISSFLPKIDEIMDEGLVTVEKVQVLIYRQSRALIEKGPVE